MTKTTIATPSNAPAVSGYQPDMDRHVRLALHVLRQALDDAAKGMAVSVDALRPWALIAGVSHSSVEKQLRSICAVRRKARWLKKRENRVALCFADSQS